ncbi:MAG: M1 family metallopeptidase [bacterium]
MRGIVVAVAVLLLARPAPPPAVGQSLLEDVVARAFDVAVTIAPVDLRIDVSGGLVRLLTIGTLRGRARIELEITAPEPVTRVRMDLDGQLTVRSVQADGAQVKFERSGDLLTLTFAEALRPGARVPVTVEYDGQTYFIYNEFVLVHAFSLYPLLISPFGDYSANMARVTMQVTAPQGVTVATTGRQISADGGTLRWDSDIAVPWVAVAGGRRHRRVDRSVGNTRVQLYAIQGEDRNLDKLATYTGQTVEYYSRLLYPFPYVELKVVSLLIVSGGIGYPALMLIDDRAFAGTLPGGLNRDSSLFGLMAHEAAHSYVPGQMAIKGVGWIWLSEGFAEYLSLMALEAVMGPQAYGRELQEERDQYAEIAGTRNDRPISAFARANYGGAASRRVIYAKGSLVLHMLRFVLGEDAFRKTLATYFQRFRGRSVRVDDFRDVAEEVSGQKLEWFFDQWISQVVLPDYVVASATSARTEDGQFRTTATIRNTGTGAMPVEVAFGTGDGRVTRRVEVPSRGEAAVTVTTPAAIRQVEVDPSKWIIQSNYKNDTGEVR